MNDCINFLLDENQIRVERDSSTNRVLSESYDSDESTDSSLDASQCEQQFVRSAHIVHQLKLVATRVENAIAGNASLRQFGDAIIKYKDLFLENMEMSLTNAIKKSRQDVERVVSIAENHWLVTPNRLERWIGFKMAELVMFEWMTQVEGVTFLANENHLKEELASLGNEFAIVLFIPSLDEWSSQITEELKNVDPFTTPSQLPMEDHEPWHLNEETQKPVFDQICQLTGHVKSDTSEQWKLFISFEDNGGSCGHFSIYKGENVVKSNLKDLPISLDELKAAPEIAPSQQGEPGCIVPDDFVEIAPSETTAGDGVQMQVREDNNTDASGRTAHKVDLPAGEFATNCTKCNVTCSRYTQKLSEAPSDFCSACPGKCSWTCHSFNTSYFTWWVHMVRDTKDG